jgi:hypothetical protein
MNNKKILILDAAEDECKTLPSVKKDFVDYLEEIEADYQNIVLSEKSYSGCIACGGCERIKPKLCVLKDDGTVLLKEFVDSGLLLLFTPFRFGTYPSRLKALIDRMQSLGSGIFQLIRGEMHFKPYYESYPDWFVVAEELTEKNDTSELFKRLFERNMINMWSHENELHFSDGKPLRWFKNYLIRREAYYGS